MEACFSEKQPQLCVVIEQQLTVSVRTAPTTGAFSAFAATWARATTEFSHYSRLWVLSISQ